MDPDDPALDDPARESRHVRSRSDRVVASDVTSGMAERIAAVQERIDTARGRAGRDDRVRLVAVSKTHPPAAMAAAVACGVTDLGENRVAELVAKMDVPDPDERLADVAWHFVGRLQSRKANDLVGRDVLVHSVDRRSLVDRFQRLAIADGLVQRILVQVNVADDPAKGGCGVHELDELVAYACEQPNLEVEGLMTMLALSDSTSTESGRHFARLRGLRDGLQRDWPGVRELSMGMSADLEAAVTEGATIVRVGTDVFGPRGQRPWQPTTKDAS